VQVKEHIYLTSEAEPVFDAADIMRFGKVRLFDFSLYLACSFQ